MQHDRYPIKRRCELREILFNGYHRRWWATFWVEHPKGCRECHATGLVWHNDYWEGWTDYDCPVCRTNDLCPWCGKKSLIKDQWGYVERCRYTNVCGWYSESEFIPSQPYCICGDEWYATERRLHDERKDRAKLELVEALA